MDVSDCLKADNCKNAEKRCLFCDGEEQYKPYKQKKGLSSSPSKKKKGMDFEETVKKQFKNYMNRADAKRMKLSGGIPGFEGDIDFVLNNNSAKEVVDGLLECKSSEQKTGGKKTITIKKEYHDKIEEEAFNKGRLLDFLVYGFKNDNGQVPLDDIYFATSYDTLLDLLYLIKNLKKENEILKEKLEYHKEED